MRHLIVARVKANGLLLVLGVALAVGLLFWLLIARAKYAAADRAHTRATLVTVCQRIHRLDLGIAHLVAANSSRKALLRTAYYRDHPGELERALRQAEKNQQIIRRADCTAEELANP